MGDISSIVGVQNPIFKLLTYFFYMKNGICQMEKERDRGVRSNYIKMQKMTHMR